jgi:hypothetical protein
LLDSVWAMVLSFCRFADLKRFKFMFDVAESRIGPGVIEAQEKGTTP